MSHDVYVSYSINDKKVADAIVAKLEREGIRCWIAPRDMSPGKSWGEAIVYAIDGSRLMVVILSDDSNQSRQVLREIERAANNDLIIIPFRIMNIVPSGGLAYFLSTHHWVDAIAPPLEEHLDKLAERILGHLGIESQAADAPVGSNQGVADNIPSDPDRASFTQRHSGSSPEDEYTHQEDDDRHEGRPWIIDTLEVQGAASQPVIQFCVDDLTRTGPNDSVDVLVVSAFRDDYYPMPGSLIGALYQKGVSVEALAKDKEVDLRQAFSCWLSRELRDPPQGIQFKRILCFEPSESGSAAEHVGDIFRSLAPFLGGNFPVRTVVTPLVASGAQRVSSKLNAAMEILQQLVESAVHWMSSGLPLKCLKIVSLPDNHVDELTRLFSELKSQYSDISSNKRNQFSYDFFISYSHQDVREVEFFEQSLLTHKSDLRIFIDRKNLNTGAAWQREIFESIDDSKKVAVFYSPSYLDSKVCIEEFNIALCRHRESDEPVLMPIYLYSTKLPTYMRLVQFFDCREFDRNKFNDAALELIKNIHK